MIRFKCPAGAHTVTLAAGKSGEKVVCPECNLPVTIPSEVQQIRPTKAVVPAATTGALVPVRAAIPPTRATEQHPVVQHRTTNVPCPKCAQAVAITPQQLNRPIRCGACDHAFVVKFEIESAKPTTAEPPTKREEPKPAPVISRVVESCGWERVQVSARILHWPRLCVCCAGQSDTERIVTCRRSNAGRTRTRTWEVPYCAQCTARIERKEISEAARYAEFYAGVHTFEFWNPAFTTAFVEANGEKVLNRRKVKSD